VEIWRQQIESSGARQFWRSPRRLKSTANAAAELARTNLQPFIRAVRVSGKNFQ
jgi:hypothetical protein